MKPIRFDAFNLTPEDTAWRIRDTWLGNADNGLKPVLEYFIPGMEIEAAGILRRHEPSICCDDEPKRLGNHEAWRLWWMNEAHHLSTHYGSTPDADYSLPDVSRHAINVLNCASELRTAMDNKDVERTALFSTLLTLEAIQGGYSMEFDAAKNEIESLRKKRDEIYKKSIGNENEDQKRARKACVAKASELWKANSKMRIGEVANELNRLILENFEKLPTLDLPPKPDTIKKWLKEAAKAGDLTIPEGAQKRGAPTKAK